MALGVACSEGVGWMQRVYGRMSMDRGPGALGVVCYVVHTEIIWVYEYREGSGGLGGCVL